MIPDKGKPILWKEMTYEDIEKLTKTMNIIIVPIGSCEQHVHITIGSRYNRLL